MCCPECRPWDRGVCLQVVPQSYVLHEMCCALSQLSQAVSRRLARHLLTIPYERETFGVVRFKNLWAKINTNAP